DEVAVGVAPPIRPVPAPFVDQRCHLPHAAPSSFSRCLLSLLRQQRGARRGLAQGWGRRDPRRSRASVSVRYLLQMVSRQAGEWYTRILSRAPRSDANRFDVESLPRRL